MSGREWERWEREINRSHRSWVWEMWAYRVVAVVLLAALVWVAFHSEERESPHQHPTITSSER